MTKVSVIIPVYNLGKYLQETIDSVTAYPDKSKYEIIIINDGSTDRQTVDLLAALEADGFNILNQNNLGLGAARNNGIAIAKGDYIIPLDADNRLRNNYLDRSIELLDANPEIDIVYGDKQYFGENSDVKVVDEFSFPKLCSYNYIDACACFRKSVWTMLGGYDEKMPVMGFEDWDFWLRASLRGCSFHHLNEVAFDYRVRSDSMIYDTMRKKTEVLNYMKSKKELSVLEPVKNCYHQGLESAYLKQSKNYKLGKFILDPFRSLAKLFN